MNEKTKNALLSIVASLVCIVVFLWDLSFYTASTRRTQWMDLHESSKAAFT